MSLSPSSVCALSKEGGEVFFLRSMIRALPISLKLRMISRHLRHRSETLERVDHDGKTSSGPICELSVEIPSGTGHHLKPSTNLSGSTQRVLQVKGVEVVSSDQGTSNGKHKKMVHELGTDNVMNSNVINSLNIGALDKSPPQNIQNISASSIGASGNTDQPINEFNISNVQLN